MVAGHGTADKPKKKKKSLAMMVACMREVQVAGTNILFIVFELIKEWLGRSQVESCTRNRPWRRAWLLLNFKVTK